MASYKLLGACTMLFFRTEISVTANFRTFKIISSITRTRTLKVITKKFYFILKMHMQYECVLNFMKSNFS